MIHKHLFNAMKHRAGTYTDSEQTFPLRVVVNESDRSLNTGGRDTLIASATVGVVLKEPRLRKGGRIETEGRVYRIDGIVPAPVPGLSDLKLERIEGDAILVGDATAVIPLDDVAIYNGQEIRVHVNPSVAVEVVRGKTRVTVSRLMLAVRVQDAPGLKSGDEITYDGETSTISKAMHDGVGFIKVLL